MINKEVLKEYLDKYAEIKEEYILLQNAQDYLKEDKEKKAHEKDDLHKKVVIEKSNLYHEKWAELNNMKELNNWLYHKNLIEIIFAGLLMIILGSLGGAFLQDAEFTLVMSGIVCPLFIVGNMISMKIKHQRELKEIASTQIKDVTSKEYEELVKEYEKVCHRTQEIEESLKIINERLAKLGSVKLDIENLILCLFSNLHNILRNKSNGERPFASWLNVQNIEDEPKLEISSKLQRER